MNLPEGFPPLDDLLPSNPLVYEAPEAKEINKLFTSPDSPVWDLSPRPYRPAGVQPLFKQGYYACLVEMFILTGMSFHVQIETDAVDAVKECCDRYGRLHKIDVGRGLSWLTLGAHGQKSWDDPIPEKHRA